MELTVQLIASHKEGLKALDKWFSADKKTKPDFAALNPGDVIEADVYNDKYIRAYTLKGHTTPPAKPAFKPFSGGGGYKADPNKDANIARAVALKAAVDLAVGAGVGFDKMVAHVADTAPAFEAYLTSGKFTEAK